MPLYTSAAEENGISAENFGILPEVQSVQISPDGERILFLEMDGSRNRLLTRSISDDILGDTLIPNDEGIYNWAIWINNEQILSSISVISKTTGRISKRKLVLTDWKGTNAFAPIEVENSKNSLANLLRRLPPVQDQIIDILRDDPDHILVQIDFSFDGKPAVYKLNVNTGERQMLEDKQADVDFWMTDQSHQIRYAEGYHQKDGNELRHVAKYRKTIDDNWITLFNIDMVANNRPFYFEGFTETPSIIYISTEDKNNKRALFTYDVDKQEIIEKIAGDPDYDIVDVNIGRDYQLEYYSYYREKPEFRFATDRGNHFASLTSSLFPGQTVTIESENKNRDKLIIKVTSPTMPPEYHLLNLESGEHKELVATYSDLDKSKLSEMLPVTYAARDGLEIPAYLTLPKLGEGPYPTVVMPHGGPMARDGWGFDYWVQFLTSRGIAVLQPNYRGSTGYGEEYRLKGHHEWAGKMLDDIEDGTNWMVEQGYADPDNICIAGASYGGYAALQKVSMPNNPYKCAIAFAPTTDLEELLQEMKGLETYQAYEDYITSEDISLRDASPYYNINDINAPVLLMHGTNDASVSVNQSRKFHTRMTARSKDIRYVEFNGGGHNLYNQTHRTRFLNEIDQFLKKHLQ